jgi:hypothetical protein
LPDPIPGCRAAAAQASHWNISIKDQDRLTVPHFLEQFAQVVFCFRNAHCCHQARIAESIQALQAHSGEKIRIPTPPLPTGVPAQTRTVNPFGTSSGLDGLAKF